MGLKIHVKYHICIKYVKNYLHLCVNLDYFEEHFKYFRRFNQYLATTINIACILKLY